MNTPGNIRFAPLAPRESSSAPFLAQRILERSFPENLRLASHALLSLCVEGRDDDVLAGKAFEALRAYMDGRADDKASYDLAQLVRKGAFSKSGRGPALELFLLCASRSQSLRAFSEGVQISPADQDDLRDLTLDVASVLSIWLDRYFSIAFSRRFGKNMRSSAGLSDPLREPPALLEAYRAHTYGRFLDEFQGYVDEMLDRMGPSSQRMEEGVATLLYAWSVRFLEKRILAAEKAILAKGKRVGFAPFASPSDEEEFFSIARAARQKTSSRRRGI